MLSLYVFWLSQWLIGGSLEKFFFRKVAENQAHAKLNLWVWPLGQVAKVLS